MCGIAGFTQHSGWTLLQNNIKLQLFCVFFQVIHFGRAVSEACHKVCHCNVVQQCYDVMCDVTMPHVHWSCDQLL